MEAVLDPAALPVEIRPWDDADRAWARAEARRLFAGDTIVSRGQVHDPFALEGWVAWSGDERVGLGLRAGEELE